MSEKKQFVKMVDAIQYASTIFTAMSVIAMLAAFIRSMLGDANTPKLVHTLDVLRGPPGQCKLQQKQQKQKWQSISTRDGSSVWRRCRNAVVSLTAEFDVRFGRTIAWTGTGFFVRADGHLVTAAHCVLGSYTKFGAPNGKLIRPARLWATVTFDSNEEPMTIPMTVVGTHGTADVAVLKPLTPGKDTKFAYLRILGTGARTGDKCYLLGDPEGTDPQSITEGTIRDATWVDPMGMQAAESLYTDLLGFGGNSGSPILNTSGQCIGIYTFGADESTALGGGCHGPQLKPIVDAIIKSQSDIVPAYTGIAFRAFRDIDRTRLGYNLPQRTGMFIDAYFDHNVFTDTQLNDLVTHVDGLPMGNLTGQHAPSSVTFFRKPGDKVTLTIRRGPNWDKPFKLVQTLGETPAMYNYPLTFPP